MVDQSGQEEVFDEREERGYEVIPCDWDSDGEGKETWVPTTESDDLFGGAGEGCAWEETGGGGAAGEWREETGSAAGGWFGESWGQAEVEKVVKSDRKGNVADLGTFKKMFEECGRHGDLDMRVASFLGTVEPMWMRDSEEDVFRSVFGCVGWNELFFDVKTVASNLCGFFAALDRFAEDDYMYRKLVNRLFMKVQEEVDLATFYGGSESFSREEIERFKNGRSSSSSDYRGWKLLKTEEEEISLLRLPGWKVPTECGVGVSRGTEYNIKLEKLRRILDIAKSTGRMSEHEDFVNVSYALVLLWRYMRGRTDEVDEGARGRLQFVFSHGDAWCMFSMVLRTIPVDARWFSDLHRLVKYVDSPVVLKKLGKYIWKVTGDMERYRMIPEMFYVMYQCDLVCDYLDYLTRVCNWKHFSGWLPLHLKDFIRSVKDERKHDIALYIVESCSGSSNLEDRIDWMWNATSSQMWNWLPRPRRWFHVIYCMKEFAKRGKWEIIKGIQMWAMSIDKDEWTKHMIESYALNTLYTDTVEEVALRFEVCGGWQELFNRVPLSSNLYGNFCRIVDLVRWLTKHDRLKGINVMTIRMTNIRYTFDQLKDRRLMKEFVKLELLLASYFGEEIRPVRAPKKASRRKKKQGLAKWAKD